jgi:Kef-type K+ transport system membrane component KefB
MTATSVLLLQLLVILLTARACGWLLKHFGQPSVIGEMAAGVVLRSLGRRRTASRRAETGGQTRRR